MPEDYVSVVKELADACVISAQGHFGDLIAYFCFPQERWSREDHVMRTLKCDGIELSRIFSEVFKPYLPVLRQTDATYSLATIDLKQLNGPFWSKATASPIWVAIGQKGVELAGPSKPYKKLEILSSRKKGSPIFAVWGVDGPTRDEFINSADELG